MTAKQKAKKPGKTCEAAAKAGGSLHIGEAPKIRIEAFYFDGWEDAALNPPLTTAETKAAECEQSAPSWRKLPDVPKAEINRRVRSCGGNLVEGVDFLLVCGQESKEASVYLSMVIDHALKGLHALAAHGDECAASRLVNSLARAATNFELLAYHKPEIFQPIARKRLQIPATISPQSGKAKENKELVEKLQVGAEGIFAIAHKGKGNKWTIASGANLLAVRLVDYIEHHSWLAMSFAHCPEVFDECPEWFWPLASLKPFDKVTWKAWANIAWEIIECISPNGKPEKHPAFHSRETKICNVRKGAGNDGATARADIKEAIFGAFETIATGVSPRTRQRQTKAPRQKR